MAPEIGGGLVFVLVAPGLHRRRPLQRDVARSGADFYRADRIVEPLQRGLVSVLLLLARLLADAIGAVIAGLVAVPGQRRQIHEHNVAGLDDAVGKIAPVRPGVRPRRDDDVLDVFHAGNVVEILHQMRGHLVFGDAGAQEFHAFPVRRVADGADDAETFLLVLVLDRARVHHRAHAVGPVDIVLLKNGDHVDVDEVDAEFLPGDAVLLHRLQRRLDEFVDLLGRGRPSGAFDPGERVAHVLLRDPGRMFFDLEAEVALLEQDRRAVAAQHGVAQSRLEPVPARGQRAGQIADGLVIQAKERAEAVLFHHRAGPLGAVFAQPVPIDPLLPNHSGDAEIRSHDALPLPLYPGATCVRKNLTLQDANATAAEFPRRLMSQAGFVDLAPRRGRNRVRQYLPFTTFCFCSPSPSMPSVTTSPALRNIGSGFMPSPTPGGVPVMMTSPGSMTKYCEQVQTICRQSKIMVEVLPRWRFSPLTLSHMASFCGSLISSLVTSQGPSGPKVSQPLPLVHCPARSIWNTRSDTSLARQ